MHLTQDLALKNRQIPQYFFFLIVYFHHSLLFCFFSFRKCENPVHLQESWERPLVGDKKAAQMPGRETRLLVAAACHVLALSDWSETLKRGGHNCLLLQAAIALHLGTYAGIRRDDFVTCMHVCVIMLQLSFNIGLWFINCYCNVLGQYTICLTLDCLYLTHTCL